MSLQIPENEWFPGVFREYELGTLARIGLSLKILHYLGTESGDQVLIRDQ